MTIEEYRQKMELLMMSTRIRKESRIIIIRFKVVL